MNMNSEKKCKIHISLTKEIHHKMRMKAASEAITIQSFVEELISKAVHDEKLEIERINVERIHQEVEDLICTAIQNVRL